jgi:cobalt-zinc-cadmium resistance protein CzcA
MAVFLPLFLMTGIEGRLYRPLALTVVSAMGASLILSLTFVPMLCAWWLKSTDEGAVESDVAVIRAVKRVYVPSLAWAFRHAWLVRGVALAILVLPFGSCRAVLPHTCSCRAITSLDVTFGSWLTA